jgi:hypothetical protein
MHGNTFYFPINQPLLWVRAEIGAGMVEEFNELICIFCGGEAELTGR